LIALLQAATAEGAPHDDTTTTTNSLCSHFWLQVLAFVGCVHIAWVWWPCFIGAARQFRAWLSSDGAGAPVAASSRLGYTTTRREAVPSDSDDLDDDSHFSDTDLEAAVCYFSRYGTKFHSSLLCRQLRGSSGIRRLERCSVCGLEPLVPFHGWSRDAQPRGRAKKPPLQ
jgi:hypothetical protein